MTDHRFLPPRHPARGILRAALITTCACAFVLPVVAQPPKAPSGSEEPEVVARIEGEPIYRADLEEMVEQQLQELAQQRHILLEGALAGLVDRRLLEREARERGLDTTALLDQEVRAKVPPVSEVDIDRWYMANRARVGNNSKEQLAPRIRTFLEQQGEAALREELLASLRTKYDVDLLFEPMRVDLDLETATFKGPADAPVTLVEFSDFQCPACRGFNPVLEQLLEAYPEDVRVAFLQLPLRQIHPQAQGAAEASLCARDQGKFWELHDALFADQRNLGVDGLKSTAREIGLDGETFDECLDSNRYADVVQQDVDQAARLGASGTPSVFVNGRPVSPGRVPTFEQLEGLLLDELGRQGRAPRPAGDDAGGASATEAEA